MRKPYPSDLTDAQWAILEPLIPVHDKGRQRGGGCRSWCGGSAGGFDGGTRRH